MDDLCEITQAKGQRWHSAVPPTVPMSTIHTGNPPGLHNIRICKIPSKYEGCFLLALKTWQEATPHTRLSRKPGPHLK